MGKSEGCHWLMNRETNILFTIAITKSGHKGLKIFNLCSQWGWYKYIVQFVDDTVGGAHVGFGDAVTIHHHGPYRRTKQTVKIQQFINKTNQSKYSSSYNQTQFIIICVRQFNFTEISGFWGFLLLFFLMMGTIPLCLFRDSATGYLHHFLNFTFMIIGAVLWVRTLKHRRPVYHGLHHKDPSLFTVVVADRTSSSGSERIFKYPPHIFIITTPWKLL